MNDTESEACAVCGRVGGAEVGYVHRYIEGRRFSICCPLCLIAFEQSPDKFVAGRRPQTLLEQALEKIGWKDGYS